ncbi:hypothetical protein [Streptacidiphilus sp. EB103A]
MPSPPDLFISIKTVEGHLTRIHCKLHALGILMLISGGSLRS